MSLVTFGLGASPLGSEGDSTPTDATPKQPATLLCTDEDILAHAATDYGLLVPPYQLMATANDGVFDPSDLWTLTSATTNFEASEVGPNSVVLLTAPKSAFGAAGHYLAVNSVSGNSITLRRPYKGLGVGQPPSPAGGLTAVTFTINTFTPQIGEATYDLYQRFGLDENVAAVGIQRSPGWVYDLQALRMTCVYWVMYELYVQNARTSKGDFDIKVDRFQLKLQDALGRVTVRFGPAGNASESTTASFSCKLIR